MPRRINGINRKQWILSKFLQCDAIELESLVGIEDVSKKHLGMQMIVQPHRWETCIAVVITCRTTGRAVAWGHLAWYPLRDEVERDFFMRIVGEYGSGFLLSKSEIRSVITRIEIDNL